MSEKDQNLEKAMFLGSIDHEQEVSLREGISKTMRLQDILVRLTNAPQIVTILLKDIHVETRGKIMKLVEFMEEDLLRAAEMNDQKKVLFNIQLEDDEEVSIIGHNPHIKSFQAILEHTTVSLDDVTVALDDLQTFVGDRVTSLVDFLKMEKREALERLDLRKHFQDFILLELRELMDASSAGKEILSEGNGVANELAEKIAQYLIPRFPIFTQHLEELSKQIKWIVMDTLSEKDPAKIGYLANRISSVEGLKGRVNSTSLLAKVHDHPSNRAAMMEKLTTKKK